MEKKGIPQEGLKLIACITMLIDHIGAVFFPSLKILRIIGRLAFPIYCFLLVEGAVHTKHAGRYALRLLICGLISELPYDLLFSGRMNFDNLSIMFTLLIGFWMLWAMGKTARWYLKAAFIGIAMVLARVMHVSYDWRGILVIAVFALTGTKPIEWVIRAVALTVLFWGMPSVKLLIGDFRLPIQCLGVLALIPIFFYSGQKATNSRAVQWGFYVFYPLHILALYLIKLI